MGASGTPVWRLVLPLASGSLMWGITSVDLLISEGKNFLALMLSWFFLKKNSSFFGLQIIFLL